MNNWITRALRFGEKIKRVLKKRPTKEDIENSDWTSCCKGPILKKDLEENLWVCPSCDKHHRIGSTNRLDLFFGKNSYKLLEPPSITPDPLNWVDTKSYKDRIKSAQKKTKQDCALLIATGTVNGIDITVGALNFDFIGASIGQDEGEAFLYGVQYAINNKTPFLIFACGGGQKLYESPIALSQMTRTTLAVTELKKNNLPYLVCFVDPCAGGITASFAMLGDIHFAEKGALIGFAGRKVIQATVKEELAQDFQSAEFVESHGFVDRVIHRKDLKKEIITLLSILLKKDSEVNSSNINETSELSSKTREAS